MAKRLPEVKTLYEILPKGTEGGKEFARVVDLLLVHEARRTGKNITIFNDAAGDYHGLDSFEGFRKDGTVGYQYKFYPSSLSGNHRRNIKKSIIQAAENQKKLKLKRWILVTPEDLVESSTREEGGDVTWFEDLWGELSLEFELEHWGHKKLLSLFLETRTLCLFYYPELIPDGGTSKKAIQDIRKRYDNNINTLYRKIEFVGMSVYKQEATTGVPMEHIYIPLAVVSEMANESNEAVPTINPISFLESDAKHVVLGDPGSGKSTLLRFLALIGFSKSLQRRYKVKPHNRLPILVTLRRYADELRSRKNLALIDYIQENIQGDFNLKSADLDFFEYYLDNGQTILLFDGLDELPSPQFKKEVRDRIRTLITTYPGNAVVITSRIVGYGHPFRLDEKEFVHHRLAQLQLPEIEQFVRDWYRVRIESKRERDANANDLIRILRDEDHIAIRELAQNPLLLTIVALVHRIDAVLPDERVVLYEKCTETLLNTWHTWKFRDDMEVRNRGKIERRNRRRIEAIAYWMHCLSGSTTTNQRAVVPYAELKSFMTEHVGKTEKIHDHDSDPEDLADEFIEFIKNRAGLLIEIGDNHYSFVHLTFQEYLTASHIIKSSEMNGASKIWETIKGRYTDDSWHEVIRLLIADLKSDESQEFLIESILSERESNRDVPRSRLLGGLLLDRIGPAELRKEEIFRDLLASASLIRDENQLRPVVSMLSTFLAIEGDNEKVMGSAFHTLWKTTGTDNQKLALELVCHAMNLPETKIGEFAGGSLLKKGREADLLKLLLRETSDTREFPSLLRDIESFWALKDVRSMTSSYDAFVSAACQAITCTLTSNLSAKRNFERHLSLLSYSSDGGALHHFYLNTSRVELDAQPLIQRPSGLRAARLRVRAEALNLALARALDLVRHRDWVLDRAGARAGARDRARDRALAGALDRAVARAGARVRIRALAVVRDRAVALDRDRTLDRVLSMKAPGRAFWQEVLLRPQLHDGILDFLCIAFELSPEAQWKAALRVALLPKIPQHIDVLNETRWKEVENSFETGDAGETEIYCAAWQLLFDSWLYISGFKNEPLFGHLAELTQQMDPPPLRIAHCIRDIAYGDESRTDDLVAMVHSDDPHYRAIFETCLWTLPKKDR